MEVKQNIQLCARKMSKQTHGLRTKVKVDIYLRKVSNLTRVETFSIPGCDGGEGGGADAVPGDRLRWCGL